MADVRIRPLRSHADFEACVEIQRRVWGHADLDITPVHNFCISVQTGAILLGAVDGGTMIGYVYSFPSVFRGRPAQHSHHLAVLPEYRGTGLGKRLKWAQWREALDRGLTLITWTYDPMKARNANLNLHTLGAVGRTYLEDFYGRTPALMLDADVPTDRLFVEWPIATRRVRDRRDGAVKELDPDRIPRALARAAGGGALDFEPGRPDLRLDAPRVLVELPGAISVSDGRPGRIGRWQRAVRETLRAYFRRGYALNDFVFGERAYYVLKKGNPLR